MKRQPLVFAAGALLGFVRLASADYQLSYTVERNAPDANHERFEFFARNDGNHGSGVRLLAEDIELVSDQKMVIGTLANGDADVSGYGAADYFHSDRSYINILTSPGDPENNVVTQYDVVFTKPHPDSHPDWVGGSSDFRVVRSHIGSNHGVIADSTANGGRGALIATAVVPNSATYVELIPWGLGGETGPAFGDFLGTADPPPQIGHLEPGGYNQLNALVVPEPAGAAIGCIGLALVFTRRNLRGHAD
jgi:hypothetical protein